jgi:aspartyl-tRNA(Asn)/glutamyl-tRNA(Gln) amidotransferase subunit C
MAEVNETLTRKVADLARLELSESEVKTYTAQLKQILGYVDQLSTVSVEGVEPMTHPIPHEISVRDREDEVAPSPRDSDGAPKVLDPAPEVIDGGFKVPPIL